MLNIGNRDDGVTIQVTHLPARAVFLLDIPVCDLTVLLQSVLQSVVKALFDIESDFLEIQIYMKDWLENRKKLFKANNSLTARIKKYKKRQFNQKEFYSILWLFNY